MLNLFKLLLGPAVVLFAFGGSSLAQRVAVLAPGHTNIDETYSRRLVEKFPSEVKALDASLVESAYSTVDLRDPFNMSIEEAKNAAAAIGSNYLLLVRTGVQRRSSFSRPDYYEAFAVHYLVSGRSGELVDWNLKRAEAPSPDQAELAFAGFAAEFGSAIADEIRRASADEIGPERRRIEEVPVEGSPAAVGLKPPIPYRRIKPEYTSTAYLYDVRATIDAEVDIDADGTILGIRVVRWAGFGLEESVEKAVKEMNWRPAMRNGKPLPMRVLLRYNFTKAEKD